MTDSLSVEEEKIVRNAIRNDIYAFAPMKTFGIFFLIDTI